MPDAAHRRRPLDRGTAAVAVPNRGASRSAPNPAPAPPRSRRRRRGDPLWAKLLILLGALLMTTSGGVTVGVMVLLNEVRGSLNTDNLLGNEGARDETGRASIKGPINLLLVGIDERTSNPAFGMHADSIIVVHVPATHDKAFLVSIPRDTYVDIPLFPASRYGGGQDKITASFFFGSQNNGGRTGGFQLLVKTIRQLTGIRPNGGAIVNFDGFTSIVRVLGGVQMCVDEEVRSIHIGYDRNGKQKPPFHLNADGTVGAPYPGVTPMTYHVGCQYMEPWKALDYCRQRDLLAKGDGDYGRQRHQQQFVKALAKRTVEQGVTNPTKLAALMKAVGKVLTFDGGGVSIDDWLFTLKGIDPNNLVMIKTNAGRFNPRTLPNGQAVEELSPQSIELFAAIRNDKVDEFAVQHQDWVSRDA
jgi:polyisoprenyl-teichoic acid--peptidoglycan teichoic acid transferase